VGADGAGRFRIRGLAPGSYALRAAAVGYASDSATVGPLAVGDAREIVVRLRRLPIDLPGVVVTANRTPTEIGTVPISVAVVTREEIALRSPARLEQILALIPGVTFNGEDQMDIRGASGIARGVGSRVLMLLDGHPVLSPDGGEIEFEALPLLDLEQVEVVKTAHSSVYGSNALGGVANLVTSPIDDRSATRIRASFSTFQVQDRYRFTTETLSEQGVGLQHSRQLGSVGTRLFIGRETGDGFSQNGESDRWLVRAKASSAPSAAHPWDAYAMYSYHRDGEFFVWRDGGHPYEVQPEFFGDQDRYEMVLTGATLAPVATSTVVLRLSPYLNHNASRNDYADNQDFHRATKPGLAAHLSLQAGARHALAVGGEGSYTWITSSFFGEPGLADAAVFAQDEIALSGTLSGTVGGRLDYHDATDGKAEVSVNPKIGLVFRPSERLSARFSTGRGYRAPSAIEQFVSTTQFGYRVVPNPGLRGESVWSTEIGVVASPAGVVHVDAAVFHNEFHDLIGPAPAPDQFLVFQFQNVTRARITGADVTVRTGLPSGLLAAQVSYMFLDSEDKSTGKALPYRSRHNVTGTVSGFQGLVGVDIRYRSRVEEVLVYPLDARDAITVADLRLAYGVRAFTFFGRISNLFNTFYTDVQERNPGAPRNLSISVVTDF
jgi:iron complex outermembrane receptor protein